MDVRITDAADRGQRSALLSGGAAGRAVRITGPGRTEMVELPLAKPRGHEVLVRLEGCGVCASNLEPWAGPDWMSFPTEPGGLGHEAWGRIEAVGPDVRDLSAGQRVTFLGQNGYASHDTVPASSVVTLPPELDDMDFPGEPFGCAFNVFRRSGIGPGSRVAIVGIGFIGAVLVRLAAEAGATVYAISRRESSLALARRMGSARTIAMEDHHAILGAVRDWTDGAMCDVAIEAVGQQWPLDLAAELVGTGGRLVVAGYHQGPRQVDMQGWNWRGIDVVNAHERRLDVQIRGIEDAVAAVRAGRLDPRPLLTHSFPLDRLDAALDTARDRPEGFVKAVVTCE